MRKLLLSAAACAALALGAFAAQEAKPSPQTAPPPKADAPKADPYANNAAPGTLQFPLAAPAGRDSHALTTPPTGAVNQGPFDPATWKYGPAFDPPAGSKIWNPV